MLLCAPNLLLLLFPFRTAPRRRYVAGRGHQTTRTLRCAFAAYCCRVPFRCICRQPHRSPPELQQHGMPLHCWNNVQRWCMQVDGKVNEDAAWYYATPKSAAENIKVGLASCAAVLKLPEYCSLLAVNRRELTVRFPLCRATTPSGVVSRCRDDRQCTHNSSITRLHGSQRPSLQKFDCHRCNDWQIFQNVRRNDCCKFANSVLIVQLECKHRLSLGSQPHTTSKPLAQSG
jgi:hypothetical protein